MNSTPLVTTCTDERERLAPRPDHSELTAPPVADLSSDGRFAELVALACIDGELAERYRREARTVLAEFGIELAAGQTAPALPHPTTMGLSPIDVPIDPTGLCGGELCCTIRQARTPARDS